MKRKHIRPARLHAGFTLLELLVVMAIMVTLASLSMPRIGSALTGMKITTATQVVVDEIQLARATALARNAPVEVWFLKTTGPYHAVRSKIINQDSTPTWISRQRTLPEGIAFASSQLYSNILGAQTAGSSVDLPSGTTGVGLRIFPSGRLEMGNVSATADPLGPNDFLYLTVASLAGFDPDGTSSLPKNFATVQINPINARVVTMRP